MCIVRYEVRRETYRGTLPRRIVLIEATISSTTVLLLLFLTNRCQRTEGNFIYPRGKKVIFYRQFYDQRHDSNNNSAIIETTGGEKKSSSFVIYLSSWNSLKKKVTLCARNNILTLVRDSIHIPEQIAENLFHSMQVVEWSSIYTTFIH